MPPKSKKIIQLNKARKLQSRIKTKHVGETSSDISEEATATEGSTEEVLLEVCSGTTLEAMSTLN